MKPENKITIHGSNGKLELSRELDGTIRIVADDLIHQVIWINKENAELVADAIKYLIGVEDKITPLTRKSIETQE